MRKPLAKDALKQLAEQHGVCVRPLALRRTDTATGLTEVVEVPCGATLAVKCKPCAERGRRLRIQQIREGWHLTDEPAVRPDKPGEDVLALVRVRAHLEFEREAVQYQPMTPTSGSRTWPTSTPPSPNWTRPSLRRACGGT
nr:replication initiator [Micromonospora tarapacensis]